MTLDKGGGVATTNLGHVVQDDRLGSVIQGRYRLLTFLARGGMGAVYLCEDLRLTGQKWAIKEMLPPDPGESVLVAESFRREAQMLSRLRHPSLPAIVDFFQEEERHYLVMEYISGLTLAQHVQKHGPQSQQQARQWGLELLEVLHYLHTQSPPVIFRDLKPDNVLVSEAGTLKLVDFGLARHFRSGQRRDTQAAGSVGYSPPELWEDREQSDQRSDIYGWGAVMHFLLCGQPPSPSYSRQKLTESLPDPNGRLAAVVLKCLEPDPGLRYQNCTDLSRALRGPTSHPAPQASRRRWPLLALMPGLLLMMLAWAAWRNPSGTPLSDPSQLDQILARTAPLKASLRLHGSLDSLKALVHDYPMDGDAQIMLGNALAQQDGGLIYHIPVITSISGTEYEGIQMLNGLALAQREINQAGGVRASGVSRRLVLDVINCDSRQDLTLEAYQRVANQPEYSISIGPWSSQQMLLVAPLLKSARFPTIAPTASDPRTTHLGAECFTVADSDEGRVRALARFFSESGFRRAVILNNQESVIGHSSASAFRQEFGGLGGSIVAEVGYLQDTDNYSASLDRVEQAQADCLFVPDYRASVVRTLVRQLRARGSTLKVGSLAAIYSGTALQDQSGTRDLVVCSYFFPQDPSPVVRDFVERYRKLTQSNTPSHREAYAYDCLYLIAESIREVGYRREELIKYLDSIGKDRPVHQGVSGSFCPSRHQESRHAYILEVHDGQLKMLR